MHLEAVIGSGGSYTWRPWSIKIGGYLDAVDLETIDLKAVNLEAVDWEACAMEAETLFINQLWNVGM